MKNREGSRKYAMNENDFRPAIESDDHSRNRKPSLQERPHPAIPVARNEKGERDGNVEEIEKLKIVNEVMLVKVGNARLEQLPNDDDQSDGQKDVG